jgi:molybdopterin-guanine dinucleotide biosynthesis protein A
LEESLGARAKGLIHPVTGRALGFPEKLHALDFKGPADERVEIDSGGNHVAAQDGGGSVLDAERTAKRVVGLGGKEGDLAFVGGFEIQKSIAFNAAAGKALNGTLGQHGVPPGGAAVMAKEIMARRNVKMLDMNRHQRHLTQGSRAENAHLRKIGPPYFERGPMTMPAQSNGWSALLLAGGQSTRMGTDKAALSVGSEVLWRRQLRLLRLAGASELWICGRPGTDYCLPAETAAGQYEVVFDEKPGMGPLAGIVAGLKRAHFETVLVLAVDMPAMSADFLRAMIAESRQWGCGIVPGEEGRFEPLAAVYTRSCLPLLEAQLGAANGSLQHFMRQAVQGPLMRPRPVALCEKPFFLNVNTLRDLAGIERFL